MNIREALLIPRIKGIENNILYAAILYITVPILIYAFGWLKLPIAILLCVLLLFFINRFTDSVAGSNLDTVFKRENLPYFVIIAIIIGIWTFLSGTFGIVYQNTDYIGRNAIYRDLRNFDWPVMYDLSTAKALVQQLCGQDKVAFGYYYTFWLLPSLISDKLKLSDSTSYIVLGIYSYIGMLLVVLLLIRIINKCSYFIPALLIFFSGIDFLPAIRVYNFIPTNEHIEWWAEYFQYSANTTQLYWVFNQSIPLFIIMALFLQLENQDYTLSLAALSFAYSPWATIGLIPYSIYSSLKEKSKIRTIINPINILIPLCMLVIFGSFYTAGSATGGEYGLIFNLYSGEIKAVLLNYISFIVFEFLIYFLIPGKGITKENCYLITLIELLIIPMFIIRDNNFCMRASIPALFMLMYYIMNYLINHEHKRIRYVLLIIALIFGALTPVTEIARVIERTARNDAPLIQEYVYSIGNNQSDNDFYIELYKNQYFIYNPEDTFFFRYLGKL